MPKNKAWTYVILVVMGILLIAAIRGCKKANKEAKAKGEIQLIADSALTVIKEYKRTSDSSAKQFKDTIEFERGQNALLFAQKIRTEINLQDVIQENKALIRKYKQGDYTDTSAVTVPGEFVTDCQGCFVKLEKTTGLVERYKIDINNIQSNWDKQTETYQKRFKQLEAEKIGFYNQISSLTKQQQDAANKLKPHGTLYLSWGVLWRPWPVAAGAGFMYQNKRNIIWGAKAYYGQQRTTVETTINLPLSLRKTK